MMKERFPGIPNILSFLPQLKNKPQQFGVLSASEFSQQIHKNFTDHSSRAIVAWRPGPLDLPRPATALYRRRRANRRGVERVDVGVEVDDSVDVQAAALSIQSVVRLCRVDADARVHLDRLRRPAKIGRLNSPPCLRTKFHQQPS